ncbi:MAG: hypothetical protein ACLQOO_32810 [Terriglobia bacterium]
MTFNEALAIAPTVIGELGAEFVRRGDECLKADKTSQPTACMFLALRSVSLLLGMGKLMDTSTFDSWDVLARSFLESTDLLMTFRFDDEGARTKIGYWFARKVDSSWKADHHKCEEFIRRLGQGETEFATRWSVMTTLSHPTLYAAQNSAINVAAWVRKIEGSTDAMVNKVADYLTLLAKLIVITTFDLPGWVPLGFDLSRMPNADRFQTEWKTAVGPVHALNAEITLPEGSYRSASQKSANTVKTTPGS